MWRICLCLALKLNLTNVLLHISWCFASPAGRMPELHRFHERRTCVQCLASASKKYQFISLNQFPLYFVLWLYFELHRENIDSCLAFFFFVVICICISIFLLFTCWRSFLYLFIPFCANSALLRPPCASLHCTFLSQRLVPNKGTRSVNLPRLDSWSKIPGYLKCSENDPLCLCAQPPPTPPPHSFLPHGRQFLLSPG